MTAGDVAELLGVPTSWVYEQSRQGQIPTVTLGRYRRYRREAIERWVEELEVGEGGGGRASSHRASIGHGGRSEREQAPDRHGVSVAG